MQHSIISSRPPLPSPHRKSRSLPAALSFGFRLAMPRHGLRLTKSVSKTDDKIVGFSAIRAKVHLEGDAPRAELDALVRHADRWSPVANTLRLPVNVSVDI